MRNLPREVKSGGRVFRIVRPILLIAILLAGALAGCAAKPAPVPSTTSPVPEIVPTNPLLMTGSECVEVGFFLPVKSSDVRPFVPAKYKIIGEPGGATLLVAAARCEFWLVPGGIPGGFNVSDVGVQIEPVDGAPGDLTLYQPWQATDRADVAAQMESLGMPPGLSPGLALTKTGMVKVGNPGTVKAAVPWPGGAYEINANVESASPGTAPFTKAVWWHEGAKGTIRMQYDLVPTGMNPAGGTVTTAAGTPMAKLLGGTTGAGAGIYWSFDARLEAKLMT